jgi:pimeloyl-ACP methyl ester carboxylesterase
MPKTLIGRIEVCVVAIAAAWTLVHITVGASGSTRDDYWDPALLIMFVVALILAFQRYSSARQSFRSRGGEIRATDPYTLDGHAPQIACPTLVLEGENDFGPGQATPLYEALRCQKTYHLFPTAEGGGEHCQVGAVSRLHEVVFDWVDTPSPPSRPDIATCLTTLAR